MKKHVSPIQQLLTIAFISSSTLGAMEAPQPESGQTAPQKPQPPVAPVLSAQKSEKIFGKNNQLPTGFGDVISSLNEHFAKKNAATKVETQPTAIVTPATQTPHIDTPAKSNVITIQLVEPQTPTLDTSKAIEYFIPKEIEQALGTETIAKIPTIAAEACAQHTNHEQELETQERADIEKELRATLQRLIDIPQSKQLLINLLAADFKPTVDAELEKMTHDTKTVPATPPVSPATEHNELMSSVVTPTTEIPLGWIDAAKAIIGRYVEVVITHLQENKPEMIKSKTFSDLFEKAILQTIDRQDTQSFATIVALADDKEIRLSETTAHKAFEFYNEKLTQQVVSSQQKIEQSSKKFQQDVAALIDISKKDIEQEEHYIIGMQKTFAQLAILNSKIRTQAVLRSEELNLLNAKDPLKSLPEDLQKRMERIHIAQNQDMFKTREKHILALEANTK
jgi:hypothetical protein